MDLVQNMLFELRRGGHILEIAAAASIERDSAGAALLDELGAERAKVALALELQAEKMDMPQAVGIDELLASAVGFVAEGNKLNTAHVLAAVAARGCPTLKAGLRDAAAHRLKAKLADGKF